MADYTADGYVAVAPDFAPVSVLGNQTPGDAAVNEPYTTSPSYAVIGGYDPNAVGSVGGGYDPDNPSYGQQANSIGGDVAVSQNYGGAPDYNATPPGGYDPNDVNSDYYTAGGYDPTSAGPAGGVDPSVNGLDDPSNARLQAADLPVGGGGYAPKESPSVVFQGSTGSSGSAGSSENDWRIRISLADKATILYKDPNGKNAILSPLIPTNGVIFPYTPQITVTHSANYSSANPTHSNYPQQFYNNSEVQDIQIAGDFTVQSVEEGQYLMACIYFFRSATKMFFGSGTNVGNPPPIVFLDGYGDHYFPHVPCVISGFTHTLSNDVDYISVPITSAYLQDVPVQPDNMNIGSVQLSAQEQQYVPSLLQSAKQATTPDTKAIVAKAATTKTQFQTINTNTRVPTNSQITITLKPVYSRTNLHNRFDLNKFAAGQLLQDKKAGFGGFL
jgi:hypothetical protein